jgi:hypothetical protein
VSFNVPPESSLNQALSLCVPFMPYSGQAQILFGRVS